jgi:hypothetical protein
MLQDASTFYLGTGIVSRLYMGTTLVWPSPSGNLWQFSNNPLNKTLSNFRVTYTNGSITADWGDGNTSGINSNVNYNYTWGNYQSDNFYYVEGSGAIFDFNQLGSQQRMNYDANNNYWVKYFGTIPQPVNYSVYYRFWDGTGGLGVNNWWGGGFGPNGTAILSGSYSRLDIVGDVSGNFKLTFQPNTLQYTASASPRLESTASSYLVSDYQPIDKMKMDFNYYYDGWRYEKIFKFNQNTGINFRFLFSGGTNNATYGDSNGDGSLEVNGNFISLNAISGRSYKFALRVFELDYIPYEVIDLGII